MTDDAILKISDLRVGFDHENGELKAVRGVSFDLRQGEILGIIGESGCGKSLTALSLLRLIPSNQGNLSLNEFMLNGKDVSKLGGKEFKSIRGKEISIIFQDPMTALNPVMTIFKQMLEAVRRNPDVPLKNSRKFAADLLKKMRLADVERVLDSYPHELSGGMKQRVMIAMALACDPKILIADEPTTALDLTVQAQILNLLLELKQKRNLSIIFITHDIGIVSNICDRILVMYAGKIVERGTTAEIFNSPRHPYTKGLLNSLLRKKLRPKQKLSVIPGRVPALNEIRSGCSFYERCFYKKPICETKEPDFISIKENHSSACFATNEITDNE